jgi:hypothetical protein
MTKYDIGLMVIIFAIGFDLVSLRKEVRRLSLKLLDKVDKPAEESWLDKRKTEPSLTKDELDKIMTPEEKDLRKKLYGSEYPTLKK